MVWVASKTSRPPPLNDPTSMTLGDAAQQAPTKLLPHYKPVWLRRPDFGIGARVKGITWALARQSFQHPSNSVT